MSASTPPERPCILLVDDEEALVWSVSNRVVKVRPDYTVLPVCDGKAALRVLTARHVDLLVTDIRMPGMSGLELIIAARRLERALPVIVMTAYPTADLPMDAALRRSIEYLQKPFEFDRFLGLVEDLIDRKNKGFWGAISVQTLPDIVQLYALSNATGALWVKRRGREGRIWFEHGAVTHAATGDLIGEEAFHTIVVWSGGEFSMAPGETAPQRSIRASWTELLMESCKRLDDLRRSAEAHGPSSTQGWSVGPSPSASTIEPAYTEHVIVDMMLREAEESARRSAKESAEESAEESVKESVKESGAATAPPSDEGAAQEPQLSLISLEEIKMANAKESLSKLDSLDGFIGAALVDSESGMLLGSEGGGGLLNIEVAGASNTEVVRAKRRAIKNLGLKDEIEDILISLNKQYHLIRPLRSKPTLFFYLALDRNRSNLALARMTLAEVERDLQT